MGTVYSVEHTVTGEILALKVMNAHLGASADAVARFKREARAASTVRSQHVVRIFDADVAPELGGAPYLVMDLLEGHDLEQVSNNKPVDPEDVVEWFRQVAQGLDKAHRLGVVHRDLKPENLFLTKLDDGTPLVKILDFGIAKIPAESPEKTLSGQVFGTPLYMAPEQARGEPSQIGPATDLYALGQIAFRLLTGVPYRTGTNVAALLTETLKDPLQSPSEKGQALGAGFDAWFLRACAPNPAARFSSAREQVEALALALGFARESDAAAAPPPSSVGPWESGLHRAASVAPEAAGNFAGAAGARGAASARGDVQASPSPSLADPPPSQASPGGRRGWRIAFVAAVLVIAIPAAFVAVSGTRSPETAASPRTGDTASSVAIDSPIAARPGTSTIGTSALAADAGAPTVLAAPSLTTAIPLEREPSRPILTRPVYYPPSRLPPAPPPRKASVDDDPLSDQK